MPFKLNRFNKELGVKRYIMFIEKWVVITSIAFLFPTILRLYQVKLGGGNNIGYLIDQTVGAIVLLIFIIRAIRNILIVREDYINSVENSNDDEVPPDPTISVLGEYWWKIIASLVAIWVYYYPQYLII